MKAGGCRWPPAKYRAFIASIIDALHVPLSELARLTDRQMIDVYNHPRDKEGRIKEPSEPIASTDGTPASLERDLRDLTMLAGMFPMPKDKYESLVEQIKAKWAAKAEGGSPNG